MFQRKKNLARVKIKKSSVKFSARAFFSEWLCVHSVHIAKHSEFGYVYTVYTYLRCYVYTVGNLEKIPK